MNGDRNIGIQASELVEAYMKLTGTLVSVAERLGLVFTQQNIGQYDEATVRYRGWWTFSALKPLGYVAHETMPFSDLLDRSKKIFNFLQRWQKGPLLQIAVNLGLKKSVVTDFGSLILVGTICQLAQLAVDAGLDLVADRALLPSMWDPKLELDLLRPLFKLNELRIADAHSLGTAELVHTLNIFGVDSKQYVSGWGGALDKIYDTVIVSLNGMRALIVAASPDQNVISG